MTPFLVFCCKSAVVPEGPSSGMNAELSATEGTSPADWEGSALVAGVSAALVCTLPVSVPETVDVGVVCACAVAAPVILAIKSAMIPARATEGRRVVTTKSIEIKDTTAEAMCDLRYFLSFGCESAGD